MSYSIVPATYEVRRNGGVHNDPCYHIGVWVAGEPRPKFRQSVPIDYPTLIEAVTALMGLNGRPNILPLDVINSHWREDND